LDLKQFFDERLDMRADVFVKQFRADQSHAAVDVVADTAGRNDAPLVRIGRANTADAEPVTPMDVGHRKTGDLNSRQKGNVGNLLGRLIAADMFHQFIAGVNQPIDAHTGFVTAGNPPAAVTDPLKRSAEFRFLHRSVPSSLKRRF